MALYIKRSRETDWAIRHSGTYAVGLNLVEADSAFPLI